MVYKLGWGQLHEIPNDISTKLQWNNLQLDIVGFLAILGEGAVEATSQVATLSKMMYIPRLLPAPQALLRPNRHEKLKSEAGQATGVGNGNHRDYVNFLGHVLLQAHSLPEYAVKLVHIRRKPHNHRNIKAKPFGPTHVVALLCCFLACLLLGIAMWQHDGMAMLAVICLSFLSTLVGVANKWKLNLPQRKAGRPGAFTPPGDLVIRYPKGSFVVVRCHEDVARELFFAPETIEYMIETPWKYRMVALVGSILLMFGVIFLGNAGTNSQVAFAVSYMIVNAAHWIIAALPQRYHWDTSGFEVIPEAFEEPPPPEPATPLPDLDDDKTFTVLDEKGKRHRAEAKEKALLKNIPKQKKRKPFVSYNKTFTVALWKVIVATRDIDWVRISKAAPDTPAWKAWLKEALERAKNAGPPTNREPPRGTTIFPEIQYFDIPKWDAQQGLNAWIEHYKVEEADRVDMKTARNKVSTHSLRHDEKDAIPGANMV